MNMVKITRFIQDARRLDSYNYENGFVYDFDWFVMRPPRQQLHRETKFVLETKTGGRMSMITGMIPVVRNVYCGDIKGITTAIMVAPDGGTIVIVQFTGHKVKTVRGRKGRIRKWLKEMSASSDAPKSRLK